MNVGRKRAFLPPVMIGAVLFGSSACGLNGRIALGTDREDGAAAAGNGDGGTAGAAGSGATAGSGDTGGTNASGTGGANASGTGGTPGSGAGGAAGSDPDSGGVDGGSSESLWLQTTPAINQMALDSTHLYWVADGLYAPPEVWRAELASRSTERLVVIQNAEPPLTGSRVYSLAIDETYVYFTATFRRDEPGGMIMRVPKQGGSTTPVVPSPCNPMALAVDDTHVYFNVAASPDGEIGRVRKGTLESETFLTGIDNPWNFVADSTHLYISEMNRGRIVRVPKAGGALEVLSQAYATRFIALGGDWVYFQACSDFQCSVGSMRMNRVPRTGGVTEQLVHPGRSIDGRVTADSDFVVSGGWFWPADSGATASSLTTERVSAVAANHDRVFLGVHESGKIFSVPNPLAMPF